MIYFREDIRLNDIRYNTLLPIAITGYTLHFKIVCEIDFNWGKI